MRWTCTLLRWPHWVSLLLGLLLFGQPTLVRAQGQVADSTELRVLRQLFRATNGAQWAHQENWPATDSDWAQATLAQAATWYGVSVQAADVTSLALPGNNLVGTLPASLGQLIALTSLELRNNALQGSLPANLGQLSQLQQLLLSNNQLSGELPTSLGQLRSLRILAGSQNAFTGPLPTEFSSLVNLTYLELSNNQLTNSLPASMSQCSQLQWLYLSNNQLSGPLPAAWGQFHQLHQLFLNSNALTGALPPSWGGLVNLLDLALSYNQLSGPLPDSLAQLQSLNTLGIDHNQFTGSLRVLPRLPGLNFINAAACRFSGELPAGLGQLQRLHQLYLDGNQLSGPIPVDLVQAPLWGGQVQLNNNQFTGTLPAGLVRLGGRVDNNNLTDIEEPGGTGSLYAGLSCTNNLLSYAALERLYQGPGQPRLLYGSDARGQRPPVTVDTVSYAAGQLVVLTPSGRPAQHPAGYQWQRLVGGQWTSVPGETQAQLRRPAATAADQGSYRRLESNAWINDPGQLASAMLYADMLPYPPLARNLPDDRNQGPALAPARGGAEDSTQQDVNYVRSWSPRVALTQASRVAQAPVDSVARSTQYLDGLGRPVQTVLHQASPQRRDLVQAQAYDGLGREPRQYLPYPAAPVASRQGYHAGTLAAQDDFYRRTTPPGGGLGPLAATDPTLGVARTGAAFAETAFEASPLNRVLAQGAAGETWQLTGGHVQERQERPNTDADSVLRFTPGYEPKSLDPGYQGYYAPGELWGTELADAHGPNEVGAQGYRTLEWKDKLGQVVLKQVEASRTGTGGNQHSRWLRTAYVYDDFSRLRFVLQPEGTKALLTPATASSVSAAGLLTWLPCNQASGLAVTDVAGQHLDGQLTGGTWSATSAGPAAQVLTLVGSARFFAPVTPQGQAFTVAFWIKPTQLSNYSSMVSAHVDDGSGDPWGSFALHTTADGTVAAGINYWSANGRIITAPGTMQAGVWQHFVFTYDQGTGTLYRDGQMLATLPDMPPAPTWPGLLVGTSNGSEPFAGELSDLRVYQRALTASEVQILHQPSVVAAVNPHLFHYRYDGRGRQIAKQVPGQDGETLVVYDQLDRPVLSQDASQRTRKEWSWTKYDALGRVVLSGLVTRQDTLGQVSLQAVATADTATSHQYEQRSPSGAYQYYTISQSFPKLNQDGFSPGQVLSATYYDDYDPDNNGQVELAYDSSTDNQFPSGQAPVADMLRTQGLVTQTKTRVLGVAEGDATQAAWLSTTTFYDERARPVQVQTTNARKGTDLLTTQLDFTGKVVQSVAVHQGPGLTTPLRVAEFFTYDHTGRLLTTRQQLPGEAQPAQVAAMQYNELGQAVRKTLGTGRLTQQVDYAYNIRGWLTSVNDPAQPDPRDLFSLRLHYETGFTKGYEQYNGNLTGQTWRGRDGVQRAYGYVYDPLNRILQGDFVARAGGSQGTLSTATAWNTELDNYRLSFVSYDDNGNIATLRRRGLLQNATSKAAKQYGAVDNLTYAYVGNRLQAVDDQVTGNQLVKPASYHGAPTSLAGDFQEAGVRQGQEYLYDANGNLTADKNKGITGIAYNHLNLPRQIHFGQVGDSVVFRYTAAGQKVAKLVYQTGKPTPLRTDYLGPYQYEQDSLKFFPHSEGRVLRFVQKDPAGQATVSYQREYMIKDHLGNLRLAYRAGQVRTYLASLEQDDNTRKRETQQFDSLSVSPPIAVATPWAMGQYAARLNAGGASPQPLGPLTQLTVQKGDSLRVSAPGLYPQKVNNASFAFSLASFVASLLQPTPAGAPPRADGSRRGGLPLLQVGLNAAALTAVAQLAGGVPKGYLRVLVFNQDSMLVDQRKLQLSKDALGHYEVLSDTLSIRRDGYVTIYVGNESAADVYFDELRIEHRQGLQVQENQYDPYGLDLAGVSGAAPGLRLKNYYQFNGKENQLDLGLNWNHHDARFFDYQLGRWHVVDPMVEDGQEVWTPYQFGYDNAVRFNDPDGNCPTCVAAVAGAAIGAIIGGGVEAGMQMYRNGGHVSDWHAVGGAALQGGVTGGVAGLTAGTSLLRSGAIGAVSNVAGGVARNVYDGKPVTAGSVAKDAAVGFVTGVATHAASKVIGRLLSPCGCFTAGTGISTRLGRKPIEKVQVGDSVWAYNERTHSTALRPVTHLFRYERDTVYVLHTATGEALRTTSDHPFYVRGQWVRVKRLRVGDSLVSQSGQRHVLRRIDRQPEHVTVYNFTVDELHTYFVGQQAILVHNSGPCPLGGKWLQTTETMSAKAASYQEQITGRAASESYLLNGVKFDGKVGNTLIDAKSAGGYAKALDSKTGLFKPWFRGAQGLIDQANRQLGAAKGANIEWHFESQGVRDATQKLFDRAGVTGINLLYTAPK